MLIIKLLIGSTIGVIAGLVVVVAVLLLVTVVTGILVTWLLRRRRKSVSQSLPPPPVYDEVNRGGMELDSVGQDIKLNPNEAYGNRDGLRLAAQQNRANVSQAYEYVH